MKLQDKISSILLEKSYNGKDTTQNMEVIDDHIYRQNTGSNIKPGDEFETASYNYVAQELSVGVAILHDFVVKYNINLDGVMRDLRKAEKGKETMGRAIRDGDKKAIERMRWTYVGAPTDRMKRRARRNNK